MKWIKSFLFSNKLNNDIIVIPKFLNKSSCKELIKLLNNYSFSKAHQFENGRCNKEVFIEDPEIECIILEKIKQLRINGSKKVVDFHLPFEFYKYEIGDFLLPHEDSSIYFDSGNESNYTALIYLNDDYSGGLTFFEKLNKHIKSETGTLLLFKHHLVHESQKIKYGTKYIYRSNWFVS